ncbi:hypothetical protein [Neisseria gonorrhoeae]|uniref:hypothetical protein n=1 Tax=Neisseria gonorrhoeae TaxID=485 RepID=UPI0012AB6D82|nr:hypothetical protein [Neisseria gonorrhoeae]
MIKQSHKTVITRFENDKNANEKPQYYPRQRQTFHRHSRKSGNPKTKSRRNLSERTEPQKPASHLRLNNRTKKAEIKTSGFFFKLAIKHQNELHKKILNTTQPA